MPGFRVLTFVRLCLIAAVVWSSCWSATGQEARGTITGTVKDQQGGAIQDATVILLDSSAVRLQRTKTDEAGAFSYKIRASNLLITNPGNPLASIQIGTTKPGLLPTRYIRSAISSKTRRAIAAICGPCSRFSMGRLLD